MDFKLMEKNGWVYAGISDDEKFYRFWSHKYKKFIQVVRAYKKIDK